MQLSLVSLVYLLIWMTRERWEIERSHWTCQFVRMRFSEMCFVELNLSRCKFDANVVQSLELAPLILSQ